MKNGSYHRSLPQIQIYQRRWWLLSCFREEWGLSYVSVPYSIFPACISSTSSRIRAILKHTHTHEHPFTLIPVFLWSDTAADEKSKHSHSLKHTHGHAHVSFSTAPELLRGFQTACHVSHTLTVTSKCTLMAERTVYFFLNKWPHTHTQPSSMNSAFTILFSHTLWDWIESSQVCPKLMVIRNWTEIPSLVRMLTYQAETRDMAGQLSKGIPLVCIVMCTVEWK